MSPIVVDHVIKTFYMKILKFLSNPYLLISVFLLLLISGEQVGGFYFIYLLMALPHGGIHAVLAIAGIVLLLLNYHIKTIPFISFSFSTISISLLVLSLYFFFANDNTNYNQ